MTIGISSINGFPLPLEERFRLFREAGFGSILLWWGEDEAVSRAQRVRLAENHDLLIENVHASTERLNAIWMDGGEGDRTTSRLLQEIEDCGQYGVGKMVLHLTNGNYPPPVSKTGTVRLEALIKRAESLGVRLAFENLRLPEHTRFILDQYESPSVGLCYDSGHENRWTPEVDWLNLYGGRVVAIHLHDNAGDRDAHRIPFSGSIDWNRKAAAIAKSAYQGSLTLEAEYEAECVCEPRTLGEFLNNAFEAGRSLGERVESCRALFGQNVPPSSRGILHPLSEP